MMGELLASSDYLRRERQSETKNEFVDGQVYPMQPAYHHHGLIVVNVLCTLGQQVRERPLHVFASQMRTKVSRTDAYFYPDVVVTPYDTQHEDGCHDTLLNPFGIVEVFSPSTEAWDRGQKFQHYCTVESLTEYVLIAQDSHHVEHYVRQPDSQWLLSEATQLAQTIHLPTIDCDLPLAEVYDKVEFAGENRHSCSLNGSNGLHSSPG